MATTSRDQTDGSGAVDLHQFDGADVNQAGDEHARLRAYFPLTPGMPNGTDAGAEELMVVSIEIEPGDYLPSHRDSEEELLIVTAGRVEATIGDETVPFETGHCAVVPEMVPHGIANTGVETAHIIGVFPDTEITATFEEPLEPFGTATMTIGPAPTDDS